MKRLWLITSLLSCLLLLTSAPISTGQVFNNEQGDEDAQDAADPNADDIWGWGDEDQQPNAEDLALAEAEAERLHQEAMAKKQQGDLNGALDLLEEAIRQNPNFSSLLERARILAEQEELQEAIEAYTFAVQMSGTLEDPSESLPVFLELGQAYLDTERFNDAMAAYRTAMRLPKQSRNAEIVFKLGLATTEFALNQKYATSQTRQETLLQGLDYFDKAIRIDPNYAEALYERGNTHLMLGDADKAIDDLSQAVELDPENTDAIAQLGFVSLQRGLGESGKRKGQTAKILRDLNIAVEQLTRWLALVPEDQEVDEEDPDAVRRENVLLNRSAARIGLGDEQPENASFQYQQALEDANAAIEIDHEKPDGYFQLGLAQRMLGDLAAAAESFSETIEVTQTMRDATSEDVRRLTEALLRRGIVRFRQNDLALAKADFEQSIQLTSRGFNPRAFFWLGLCYQQQGNANDAVIEYSRALRLQPQFVNALMNRGMAYMQQGRYSRAARDFNEVLRIDDSNSRARTLRSQSMSMVSSR